MFQELLRQRGLKGGVEIWGFEELLSINFGTCLQVLREYFYILKRCKEKFVCVQ